MQRVDPLVDADAEHAAPHMGLHVFHHVFIRADGQAVALTAITTRTPREASTALKGSTPTERVRSTPLPLIFLPNTVLPLHPAAARATANAVAAIKNRFIAVCY